MGGSPASPDRSGSPCIPQRRVTCGQAVPARGPLPSSPPRSFPPLQSSFEAHPFRAGYHRLRQARAGWLAVVREGNTRAGSFRLLPVPGFGSWCAAPGPRVPSRAPCSKTQAASARRSLREQIVWKRSTNSEDSLRCNRLAGRCLRC